MDEWETMTADKTFITDLGAEVGTDQQQFCRFAVWIPEKNDTRHRIAEVGNDLEGLKKKYAVASEYIFRVAVPEERHKV